MLTVLTQWAMARTLKLGIIGALMGVGVVGSCVLRDQSLINEGAAKATAASKERAREANAKSKEAHTKAAQPGALDRLRRDPATCVDC